MSGAVETRGSPGSRQVGVDPQTIPLDQIDVTDVELWVEDAHWAYFERLRREDPVHYCAQSAAVPTGR